MLTTSLGVVVMDADTGQYRVIHEGSRLYYGLTWDERFIYAGCNRERHPYYIVFNRALEPIGSVEMEGIDVGNPHGMFYDPLSKRLFWAMPGEDSVYAGARGQGSGVRDQKEHVSLKTQNTQENQESLDQDPENTNRSFLPDPRSLTPDPYDWTRFIPCPEDVATWIKRTGGSPPEEKITIRKSKIVEREASPWRGPGSINLHHYNSVFVSKERIYVLAHNRGASEILTLRHDWGLESITPAGRLAHTAWVEERGTEEIVQGAKRKVQGETSSSTLHVAPRTLHDSSDPRPLTPLSTLFVVSSGDRAVLRNGQKIYETPEGTFPRGVAKIGERYFLGLSMFGKRDERGTGRGRVQVLSSDWKLLNEFELRDNSGQIYEIRALCADPATHNGLAPPVDI
ncbi:MAG: hypothetical protein HUU29_09490 [Planctomycetaceae bacterium]|nr:hypothetical protein [Planctomycetaceae bacterium]